MKSTTRLDYEDMSVFLSTFFGFEVHVYFMEMDSSSIHCDIVVEWSKVKE